MAVIRTVNLCLACSSCNLHKSPNIAGVDPETGKVLPLFHPRQHWWSDHFLRSRPILEPRTTIGQVTILVLGINLPENAIMMNPNSERSSEEDLNRLIEEITVDAYGDDEQFWAFRQAFEDSISLPPDGFVIGEPVSVILIETDHSCAV